MNIECRALDCNFRRWTPVTITVEVFASVLASEAGNIALKVLATGGVYLGGGVVTHTLPALERPEFMQYFKRRGQFAELMEQIPIHVITTRR